MFIKAIIKPVLQAMSYIYLIGLKFHQGPYLSGIKKAQSVNAKVISVGNLTWGGTGKTPLTIMIAESLTTLGKKVAVITRGYGHDESKELKNRLKGIPVIVNKDKVKGALEAVNNFKAEFLIIDLINIVRFP